MGTIRIEYIPLSEIVRWPRNPKDHDLGQLHTSFERWGFTAPLLRDEGTGRLVAGHGRVEGLEQRKAQGLKPPERILLREDGEWLVPVIVGVQFASEREAEAYLVADNRLAELGGWHQDQLLEVLAEHASRGEGALRGMGYDEEDIEALRIAQAHAHRLQLQERLVAGIAEDVAAAAGTEDVAVHARGEHLCMVMRGVRTPGLMETTALRGAFHDDQALAGRFLAGIQ